MGEPRWTVNDCGDPEVTNGYGKPFALTRARTNLQGVEHDALVAAVRDAELLRQARELAQSVRLMQSQDRRREAIAQADDLLDLLSPVADSGDQSEVESPRAAGIAHRDETGHDMAVIDNHKSSCAECDWSAEKRT